MSFPLQYRLRVVHTIVALCAAMVLLALPATAQSLGPFAKNPYYLGRGGTPPTLSALASDPNRYFASRAAYTAVRDVVAQVGQVSLASDADWGNFLNSGRVQLEACNGARIETSGLRSDGSIGWFSRSCYVGEQLIMVHDGRSGQWVAVASLGCLNLVKKVTAPAMPPKTSRPRQTTVTYSSPTWVSLGELNICGCIIIPGVSVMVPSQKWESTSGFGAGSSESGFGIRP